MDGQAEWRALFEAAVTFRDLAPWQWLMEEDVFAIQLPRDAEPYYCSVMGALGEHRSLTAYRGRQGLGSFRRLQDNAGGLLPGYAFFEAYSRLDGIAASFLDREFLRPEDRRVIKDLGLKFRGSGAWPEFRSYRPGYVAWFLELDEVRALTTLLIQGRDVTERLRSGLLYQCPPGQMLVRSGKVSGGEVVWSERFAAPAVLRRKAAVRKTSEGGESLRLLPASLPDLQIGAVTLSEGVREGQERPFYPVVLVIVEPRTMQVIGNELLNPEGQKDLARPVIDFLKRSGARPKQVQVLQPEVEQGLSRGLAGSGIAVKLMRRAPVLEDVLDSLLEFTNPNGPGC